MNLPTAFSNVIFPERSFLVGARGEYHRGRAMVYGKLLGGVASSGNNSSVDPTITASQLLNASETYSLYALGGGVEYRLQSPITVRVDYESQHWLSYQPNGLTPGIFQSARPTVSSNSRLPGPTFCEGTHGKLTRYSENMDRQAGS